MSLIQRIHSIFSAAAWLFVVGLCAPSGGQAPPTVPLSQLPPPPIPDGVIQGLTAPASPANRAVEGAHSSVPQTSQNVKANTRASVKSGSKKPEVKAEEPKKAAAVEVAFPVRNNEPLPRAVATPLPVRALAATLNSAKITSAPLGAAASEPDASAAKLKSIRVQPHANVIRVVLVLSKPAAYVLTLNPTEGRGYVDLINVRVDFFQSELNEIEDSRLAGIRLVSQRAEGARLEFLFASATISVDDFALNEPPAIILDFFDPKADSTYLPGGGLRATTSTGNARAGSSPSPALPAEWGGEIRRASTPKAVTAEATPQEPTQEAAPALSARSLGPTAREYQGFPIDEISVSKDAEEFHELFLNRQWATALASGLNYLEKHPGAKDLPGVLYLLAEARYQSGGAAGDGSLRDPINFYEQALRVRSSGNLGSFAHQRLAQLLTQAGMPNEALPHLEAAFAATQGAAQKRVKMQMAKALAACGRNAEALKAARQLQSDAPDERSRVEMAALEASLLQDSNDLEGAWSAFQKAAAIDPDWVKLNPEYAERFARAADQKGERALAKKVYAAAVYNSTNQAWERPGLYLGYADLLRRLAVTAREQGFGDKADAYEHEADEWYSRVLSIVDPSNPQLAPDLVKAKQALRESHASEITQGAAGYALFLEGRGDIYGAMYQLQKAYEQSYLTGSGTAPLKPAALVILEPYMSWAIRLGNWHEVLAAWQNFGGMLGEGPPRNRCLGYVAKALSGLGLYPDALKMFDVLLAQPKDSGGLTEDLLFEWKAEVLCQLGRGKEAIGRLESLRRKDTITNIRANALRVLADIYEKSGEKLEAAQASEALANGTDLSPDERGKAWDRAASLYLEEEMPTQTIDIGLRALRYEAEQSQNKTGTPWDPSVTVGLRHSLARAYYATNKFEEAAATLQSYLALKGLSADERGFGQFLLGECWRQLGVTADAQTAYQTAQADKSLPELWRKAAGEALASMEWEAREAAAAEAKKAADAKSVLKKPTKESSSS